MKRSRLRAGAYTTQTILGRSPQPVYDEGSTRSAVRHAYGFPFSISASRHSQPESRDPASHLRIAPCTGTATKQIEIFPATPQTTRTTTANRHGARGRARARRSPQGKTPSSSSARALPHKQISQSAVRRDTATRRTRRRTVRHTVHDGTCSIQRTAYSARRHMFDTAYGIQCTTAHVRYSVRHTVHDGTCSIQYGVQCATAHSSIQRTTRSTRIRK